MRFDLILTCVNIFAFTTAQNGKIRSNSGPLHDKAVVCTTFSVPSISIYSDLDLNLCSHLIYVDKSFYASKDPWDPTNVLTDYSQFGAVRRKYPHLKISLGILRDAIEFMEMASEADTRHAFVESAVDFILAHDLNGLDLIWSYRNLEDPNAAKECYVALVMELDESFKPHNFILSAAFDTEDEFGEIYDYTAMSEHLHFIHMTDSMNIDPLIAAGVDVSKITMGIVFNGFEVLPEIRSVGSNILMYGQVCDLLANNNVLKEEYDESTDMFIASFTDAQGAIRFIRFENTQTIANKTRSAMHRNLGGIFVFTIDADDAYGKCTTGQDTIDDYYTPVNGVALNIPNKSDAYYPLLRAVNDAIVMTIDELQEEQQVDDANSNGAGVGAGASVASPGGVGFHFFNNVFGITQNLLSNVAHSNGILSNAAKIILTNFGSRNKTSN